MKTLCILAVTVCYCVTTYAWPVHFFHHGLLHSGFPLSHRFFNYRYRPVIIIHHSPFHYLYYQRFKELLDKKLDNEPIDDSVELIEESDLDLDADDIRKKRQIGSRKKRKDKPPNDEELPAENVKDKKFSLRTVTQQLLSTVPNLMKTLIGKTSKLIVQFSSNSQ